MTYRVVRTSGSPPRAQLDTSRASTGTMLSTAYDTRFSTQPRASFTASARDMHRNSVFDTVPVSKQVQQSDSKSGGAVTRTTYSVKPRRESTAAETRRPLTAMTRNISPTRDRTFVESPRVLVTPVNARDDSSRLLSARSTQGSTNHRRQLSATRGEFEPRYASYTQPASSSSSASRAAREYYGKGPYVEKAAPTSYAEKSVETRPAELVTYLGNRERFEMDYPTRSQRRETIDRRDLPHTATDSSELVKLPVRRETQQPSSKSSRHLGVVDRENARDSRSGFESDPDRAGTRRRSRLSVNGPPVLHQDDTRPLTREEFADRRRTYASDARPSNESMALVAKGHYRADDDDRDEVYARERAREPTSKRQYAEDRDRHPDREPVRDRDRDLERSKPREYRSERRERDIDRDSEVERERARDKPRGKDRDRDQDIDRVRDSDRIRDRDRERERERELVERDRPREYERDAERPRERTRRERDPDSFRQPKSRETSRENSPEHSGLKKAAAATAVGGLAAAALGVARKSAKGDDVSDQEEHEKRRRRRRARHPDEETREDEPILRDEPEKRSGRRRRRHHDRDESERVRDNSLSDSSQEIDRTRPRSRSRHRPEYDREDPERREQLAITAPSAEADRRSPSRTRPEESFHGADPLRDDEDPVARDRALSPGDDEDDRPRRVAIVEPPKKRESIVPKGILKPPRAVPFPEDPNPIREGVTPLKAPSKDKGDDDDAPPPDKKWTKINRRLVNPDALRAANERFEERDDQYVIVLRPLRRSSIEKLAKKTEEIRRNRPRQEPQAGPPTNFLKPSSYPDDPAARNREYDQNRHSSRRERDNEYVEGEREQSPLQIEAPPQANAPPVDFRNLAAPQQQQNLAASLSTPNLASSTTGSARNSGDNILPTPDQMRAEQREREQQEGIDAGRVERREREQQDRILREQDMTFEPVGYSQEV